MSATGACCLRLDHPAYRARGETVIWRSRPQGLIGYVIPYVVLEDSPETIVLFQQPGSICKKRSGPRGGPRGRMLEVDKWDGTHIDVEWKNQSRHPGTPGSPGYGVARLHVPGSMISVIREWDHISNVYRGWYINLEAPWKRTDLGFDSEDLVLDITVSDDLSTWSWKDEDELDHAVSTGRLSREEAAHIRSAGEHALQILERREFPFIDDAWETWNPDPDWKQAEIPPGWDIP